MSPSPAHEHLLSDLAEQRKELRLALDRAMTGLPPDLLRNDAFERLAIRIFRYQVDANPVYGAFVRMRGIDPNTLTAWSEIPPVPTRAFREFELLTLDPRPVEVTFRTSGTTQGSGNRGTHHVRDLSLYRASLLSSAARYLRPEMVADPHAPKPRIRILSLTPGPAEAPESSLVSMIGTWAREWDDGEGRFLADPDWTLGASDVESAVRKAREDEIPVLLVGTAFGFVHILPDRGRETCSGLPDGSVVVETGGFKGRSRAVPRKELYEEISRYFDVPMGRIVNEYGMTELLSQFYEPVLLEGGPIDPMRRRHVPPPWVRSRVVDPFTLEPVALGERGILCHLDLANLDSAISVLTEDLAVSVDDGFRLLGRSGSAEPRGCSLMMEELLEAQEERSPG